MTGQEAALLILVSASASFGVGFSIGHLLNGWVVIALAPLLLVLVLLAIELFMLFDPNFGTMAAGVVFWLNCVPPLVGFSSGATVRWCRAAMRPPK